MLKSVLFAAALLASAPAFADSLKGDIDKANAKWVAAFNKGDAAAIAQLYTENATALPAGADMVKGRAAIQALWDGVLKGGAKNVSLTTVSLDSLGKAAREIGTFSFDLPGQQNQVNHVEGKYVVIWKKAKPGWQLDTDIWNMNK